MPVMGQQEPYNIDLPQVPGTTRFLSTTEITKQPNGLGNQRWQRSLDSRYGCSAARGQRGVGLLCSAGGICHKVANIKVGFGSWDDADRWN